MRLSGLSVMAVCLLTKAQSSMVFAKIPLEWENLPWKDLRDNLTSSTAFIDTDIANYEIECLSVFDKPIQDRTLDQPSGLCLPHFFCGYEGCNPSANDNMTWIDDINTSFVPFMQYPLSPLSDDAQSSLDLWLDPSNPSYNLPIKVLFPLNAGDVAATVFFANEHGVELSVKNSGHSYTGSSQKKNTILLNMNKYKEYSSSSIDKCDTDSLEGTEISSDLSNQPCKLAIARGKPAAMRVGGGENFDRVYHSIRKFNEEQKDFKLHAVGGAVGTVSPNGWSFLGGLPGTTGGRLFGFGVDQVLQIEMILPTGQHVRFGPTAWEDTNNHVHPQTIEVSGVCNMNPHEEDEDNWVWSTCEDDINFNDLWFAQLGGGGGTWGIVLSMHLQLHEYHPIEKLLNVCDADTAWATALQLMHSRFIIDFLLDPEALGVSYEESYRCTTADAFPGLYCHGANSSVVVVTAWKSYMNAQKSRLMEEDGVSEGEIRNFTSCIYGSSTLLIDVFEAIGSAPAHLSIVNLLMNAMYVLIPKNWVLNNKEKAADLLISLAGTVVASPYIAAFSAPNFSDQANSLSDAHRNAAFMLTFPQLDPFSSLDQVFYSELFQEMYDITDKNNFPGHLGSNHASPTAFGPLKSDWTKACPSTWTHSERNEKCISMQEAIYGTTTLRRLEAIKESIDPNQIFNCFRCIGNDGEYTSSGTTTSIVDDTPSDDPVPTIAPTSDPTRSGFYHHGRLASDSYFLLLSLVLPFALFCV